jgi:putative PIN family toxin of toxin-antitoxin system
MIKVVIDTNVIVSALLSDKGNPYRIIALVGDSDELQVYYSTDILAEYVQVLGYARLGIVKESQDMIISTMRKFGTQVEPTASDIPFVDESDRIFYDAAKEIGAILITGNTRHFPVEPFVMTPAGFLAALDKEKTLEDRKGI